ncbi:MAG: hypothetical protein DRG78_10750 [Epsilonproteobacteria bacterium]|nr:MAG: hypothetical protein DRG78_10750 [Campylobacterota bacterium]
MEEPKKDKWQLALDEPLKQLKQCQVNNNIDSCFKCDKILDCNIREEYIKAVYASMNKGSGGGFEF